MKKKLLIGVLFFALASYISSQSNYRGQRVLQSSENSCSVLSAEFVEQNGAVQIDVFFSSPINPLSFSGKNVLINGAPLPQDLKPIFNREGTQVRFVVKEKLPIEIKFVKVLDKDKNPVPEEKIILKK